MVDEVNLSRNSIRDIARAFADELRGGRRTTGGAGGAGGTDTTDRRISSDLVEGLFKNLVPGFERSFSQMANGATGLSSFNSAIDGSADALETMTGGLSKQMPLLAASLGIATSALSSYVQQVNELADVQFDAYVEMSKVGGADRISGLGNVMDMFNKFGYTSSRDFPKLTAYINENAQAFASFGGTVETGMKEVANVTAIMHKTGMQAELMQMGIQPDEMNKRFAMLLKNVQMAGGSIETLGKNEKERAQSVREYIKQQDIITRLTGLSAEQQQKTLDRAMSNDRYAALRVQQEIELEEAKAAGNTELVNTITATIAKNEALLKLASKIGPEFEAGMQDAVTGYVTDASIKMERTVGGAAMEILRKVPATQEEAINQMVEFGAEGRKGATEQAKSFAESTKAGMTGVFVKMNEIGNLRAMGGLTPEALEKAKKEQGVAPPGTGTPPASEAALVNVVAVRQELMRATSAFENFVNFGLRPVSDLMVGTAASVRFIAEKLPGSTPKFLEDNKALNEQMKNETGINAPSTMRGFKEFKSELRTELNEKLNESELAKKAEQAAEKAKQEFEAFKEYIKKKVSGDKISLNDNASNDTMYSAINDAKGRFAELAQTSTPSSRTNLNSSRLLADFRNSTGPADKYRQSLIDTVYRPDAENNDTRLTDSSGAMTGFGTLTENMFRDQMAAYTTMISQQGELIDLLQRSIGIQDKTLRATYNT
jgi:hypothetical protein